MTVKLHLGCGKRFLPGFIHIDIDNLEHVDFCTTIDNLSMFDDNSVNEIYTCGAIGYYDIEEIKSLLSEWRRVLVVGGKLRISVVDFEKQVELYLKTNKSLDSVGVIGPIFGKWNYTNSNGKRSVVYKKTALDFKLLKKTLESNDFCNYKRYDWKDFLPKGYDDYSRAYVPHNDESGTHIMLNVECIKC